MANVKTGDYTRTGGFGEQRDPIIPRFHLAEIEDPVASAREGRPIFRSEERVELIMPGIANLTKPVSRVTDEHRNRWPEQYERFKKGMEMSQDGTPLEQWAVLKRAMVLELKALEIHTIEQCSTLSDVACQRIPRIGYKIRELAKAYLDDSERLKQVTELQAHKDESDRKISELSEKVEQLTILLGSTHSALIQLQNAPNPLATAVPADSDMIARALEGTSEPQGQSSLDDLVAPKRGPGRPRKDAA